MSMEPSSALLTPPPGSPMPTMFAHSSAGVGRPAVSAPPNPPILKRSHATDLIAYDKDEAKRNSEYQLAWTEMMALGNYTGSKSYKKVEVLLLSWDEEGDDLGVGKEVEELEKVFRTDFHFGTRICLLSRHQNKTAQAWINKEVANWVWDHDGPRTLLIVYFAGHGKPGEGPMQLHLAGRMQPGDYRARLDRVIWNRTEENLKDTQSDVLEIFDCCHAGNLNNPRGRGRERGQCAEPRAFEYLAAAPADKRTPGPGDDSFTRALIWSLRKLVGQGKGRFTTNDLLNKIKTEAPNFSRDQEPQFSKQDDTGGEYIILSPLEQQGSGDDDGGDANANANGTESAVARLLPPQRKDHTVLTLKFVFNRSPPVEDIRRLGRNFNQMVSSYDFNINRIMWGGLHSHTDHTVATVASRFLMLRNRAGSGPGNSSPFFPRRSLSSSASPSGLEGEGEGVSEGESSEAQGGSLPERAGPKRARIE